MIGGAHNGRNRASDSRLMQQNKREIEIANVRQRSIVSEEEIAKIAWAMNIAYFNPEWLETNLVVAGCPDFSHVPPSSRFQSENGTTLIVVMQNYPCHQVAVTIECDFPGQGKSFKQHAKCRRGVTAWVKRPRRLLLGDQLRRHCPEQRAWHLDG